MVTLVFENSAGPHRDMGIYDADSVKAVPTNGGGEEAEEVSLPLLPLLLTVGVGWLYGTGDSIRVVVVIPSDELWCVIEM